MFLRAGIICKGRDMEPPPAERIFDCPYRNLHGPELVLRYVVNSYAENYTPFRDVKFDSVVKALLPEALQF